jgi:hypothetical protein
MGGHGVVEIFLQGKGQVPLGMSPKRLAKVNLLAGN